MLDFLSVAASIVDGDSDLETCGPVIEKELLHYEILNAMHSAGYLRNLVFKGGTCLRLCHGASRFSEDLDFSGGILEDRDFTSGLEDTLRHRIAAAYGLDVSVTAKNATSGATRSSSRWVARIVTRPAGARNQLGVQRINIEVNGRSPETHETELLKVHNRHEAIAGYFSEFPIRAASLYDICTDKLVALPMSVLKRENPRFRDIWDIDWCRQYLDAFRLIKQAAQHANAFVEVDEYKRALAKTVEVCEALISSEVCQLTLGRFLPKGKAERFQDPLYHSYLGRSLSALFEGILQEL